MPRLPTMRVIGSHAMSTSSLPFAPCFAVLGLGAVVVIARLFSVWGLPGAGGAGLQLAAGLAPLRLLVDGVRRDLAQAADRVAVEADGCGRELAAGRLVHERHELVGEAGHRAADADAADVRAATHAVHPAPLGDVALH